MRYGAQRPCEWVSEERRRTVFLLAADVGVTLQAQVISACGVTVEEASVSKWGGTTVCLIVPTV